MPVMIVVPNAQATAEGDLNTALPFFPGLTRYQQVYAASDFARWAHCPSSLRRSRSGRMPFSRLFRTPRRCSISRSISRRRPPRRRTEHDVRRPCRRRRYDRFGARPPVDLEQRHRRPPRNFDIVIPFTTPFLYDATLGNLLLDVRNLISSVTREDLDAQLSNGDSVSSVSGLSVASGGFPDTLGLVTQFTPAADGAAAAGVRAFQPRTGGAGDRSRSRLRLCPSPARAIDLRAKAR